jgi:hypothetical protein
VLLGKAREREDFRVGLRQVGRRGGEALGELVERTSVATSGWADLSTRVKRLRR